MTDMFREIEKGNEAKFKLDEERASRCRVAGTSCSGYGRPKAGARRWSSRRLFRSLDPLDLEKPGHVDVVSKVLDDVRRAGDRWSEREAYAAFANSQVTAEEQILDAYPMPLDSDHVQVGG